MAQEAKKQKKEKGVLFKTPLGTALWPKLDAPDTKFATAERPHGHYSVGIVLPLSDPKVRAIVDGLEALRQEALNEGQAECKPGKRVKEAQYGWSPEVDEHGQETGNVIINLKKPGAFTRDDGSVVPLKVDVFDTRGNKVPKSVLATMGSGSKIRANFEASKFSTGLGSGVSLRLQGVQLVELQTFGSRSAADYGFETDGGGYVASTDPEPDPVESTGGATATGAAPADDSDI